MSPEQCNEQGYNEKSDIWSLGIIIYEMANLSPPFQANNHLSLALKIRDGQYKRVPDKYSDELMRVIRWMLKPDPRQRPNVEDLLNLPRVSIRLRERALKRKKMHIEKKTQELSEREAKIAQRERELEELERRLAREEQEINEMED